MVNFNYTNSLDALLKNSFVKEDGKWRLFGYPNIVLNPWDIESGQFSYHIHGYLLDQNNQISIGVDNARQLSEDDEFGKNVNFLVIKRLVKRQMLTLINPDASDMYYAVETAIKMSNQVVIFGLSLCASDYRWSLLLSGEMAEQKRFGRSELITNYFVYQDRSVFRHQSSKMLIALENVENKFLSTSNNPDNLKVHFTTTLWDFPTKWQDKDDFLGVAYNRSKVQS